MARAPRRTRLLERHTGYAGFFKVFRYHLQFEKHDGTMSRPITREVFQRHNAVMVIPFDPVRREVVLVEQFRAGAFAHCTDGDDSTDRSQAWLMEFPAGMIEPGQTAEDAARREVHEETGLVLENHADALHRIHHYFTSPGGCSEQITLFAASVDLAGFDIRTHQGVPHEDEDIRLHLVPVDQLPMLVDEGMISDASTLLGVTWVLGQDRSDRALLHKAALRQRGCGGVFFSGDS